LPNQNRFKVILHPGIPDIFQGALAGLLPQSSDHFVIRHPERLERFRAAEDGQQAGIDRAGGAHRVKPEEKSAVICSS